MLRPPFIIHKSKPVIIATDFNTTEHSNAYVMLTRTVRDTWHEAGWGFGHSWGLFGNAEPWWLIRIDYSPYAGD